MINLLPASMSLFAVAAGVIHQAGNNVRVQVSHDGAPVEVIMTAVDENYNVLKGTQVFPGKVIASRTSKKVNMRVPVGTWAICARTAKPIAYAGTAGAGVHFESCAVIGPTDSKQGVNFGRTRLGGSLRDALAGPEVKVIQEGK